MFIISGRSQDLPDIVCKKNYGIIIVSVKRSGDLQLTVSAQ